MSNTSNDNPQAGQNRPLPKKESDLFKNVVKFYESKQYKKGLKNADTILKRYPNHGETLCMKGLIVNAMAGSGVAATTASSSSSERGGGKKGGGGGGNEKKDEEEKDKKKEAIELVKRGLMMDMRSHVCWHVYGLLHRSSQNYAEAIKAYKQALRIDSENLQILRDMGLLQIQMRDLAGFRDTRLRILTLRPNSKVHWLTYALAVHVGGDPGAAAGVLDSYIGTLDGDGAEFRRNFESSELALYKNQIIAETDGGGTDSIKKALFHLDEIHDVIVDQTGFLMVRLSYQLQLGMFESAIQTISSLFQRGSTEDHSVHGAYMCALLKCDRDTCVEVGKMRGTGTLATLRPLSEEERAILLRAYGSGENDAVTNGNSDTNNNIFQEGLVKAFPKSSAIKRIYLTLLSPSSEEFKSAIDQHCQRQIFKGVPSLGWDLSSLYLMEQKQQTGQGTLQPRYVLAKDPIDIKSHPTYRLVVQLVDSYIASLVSNNTFPISGSGTNGEHPPSTLLWAWYLRSILHEQVGEYDAGIALIDKCIKHTPTAVDFYELKARLLEAGGDIQSAADVVDAGRDLDHQDRYINNQATKTLLRAGRGDEARKRISLFTRHEGNPDQNLYDMQCTWYELELADCLRKKGEFGRSLRKYMAVIKHYEDFHEDQFDFHMYCIRKVTLRTYCKLLKFEDELWGLPHYGRAAEEVIKVHLHLSDNPDAKSKEDEEPDYSKMTPAERKKAKNIARKKKKAKAASAAGASSGGGKDGGKDNGTNNANGTNKKKSKPHVTDEDPEGKELLALDHLEEAKKFAAILVRHAPKRMSAWALQYDVSIRRGKMLLALQALFKMRSIDPNDDRLFSRIVDYSQKLSAGSQKGHAASEEVIASEFPTLLNNKSLTNYISSAAEKVKADALSSLPLRIAVARAMLETKVGSSGEAAALVLDSKLNVRCVTVETCREALQFMELTGDKHNKEQMKQLIDAKFPFAKDC
eukprot:CAMPEP_0183722740 /NCGR_PEP_ID=MMETSP0737-20130205/14604_1 /TAXON_ID=385413 /ORGANISM="Thalassiosira miniscula, Strain CCMP1093" /LENGTH=974 /DNA_ID=CAMNT_0025952969 /DNA_START=188 /DNA_END=3112 /DNA_ORIENTATION=+